MSEIVEGRLERIVFAAPDSRFAVVRLSVLGRALPVTVVGPLASFAVGEELRVEGSWERHASHGDQLRAERATAIVPRTPEGVARYLEGLRGIGPRLAGRLVEAFGVQAIDVLADEPWRAGLVSGVGKRRALDAAEEARGRRLDREALIFLQGLGITAAQAARIKQSWGDEAVPRLRQNPYLLSREIRGFGFATADRIAERLGIDAASPVRAEAAVHHALEQAADEGHVFLPRSELLSRAQRILHPTPPSAATATDEAAAQGLARLHAEGVVVIEDEAVYLPRLHAAEVELAAGLSALLAAPRSPVAAPPPSVDGPALSPGQQRAVALACAGGVSVVTGGPGTGKTTVVKSIVAAFGRANRKIVLCAPTGRAAKRLSDATGRPALTIHRLLEWGRGERGPWGRDAEHPLEAELVVVDESSMLDLPLARALVAALQPGTTLLLVGDVDQLPSVGPGQILSDLIQSDALPVARLDEIFRQGEGSRIIENAHRVLHGRMPEVTPAAAPGGPRSDFFLARADDPERARELVLKLCRERIPEAFGLHPSREVQVLTPMHRGEAGTEALNRALQAALNPDGEELPRGERPPLRVGDKVLQSRNDYEREVWNGDLGEVVAVVPSGPAVAVRFDDRTVRYEGDAIGDLDLAYAISIHKSQGSEYPAVIVVLLPQHYVLLRRNLLYTAISRGRKLVVLVGSERAIRRAVETTDTARRYTGLKARLGGMIREPAKARS